MASIGYLAESDSCPSYHLACKYVIRQAVDNALNVVLRGREITSCY